ncbi:MAG TPA: glycosyltransferase family 39 protein [Tepidisphaeraceae bacterium]|nr:glycosyltransferase family 39 protein [Tepidisphaeraceae bacterium]
MPEPPPKPSGTIRLQIATIFLGAIGVLGWMVIGPGRGIGNIRWCLIATAGIIACIPHVARAIFAGLDRLRNPSPSNLNRATLLVGVVSAGYFVLTAFNQGRDMFPKTHDDCSYLIGMQILAHGRLWEPALPLPDFFDSFYLLVRPVYCSLYFPGTALLYVPTIWLHLPTWLMPALASGAVVAMTYRIIAELLDGTAAALAALIVASLSWFRVYSILLTGHVPMVLMGLLLVFAWLRWRREHRIRWAVAIGVFAGWAAITRPADAVIFALPVGCAIAYEIFRHRNARTLVAPLVIILAAAPFLALQVIFDVGVTGHVFEAPYTYYLEQDQPGSAFGFHTYNAAAHPQSPLAQKQENYDRFVRDFLKHHTPGELPARWVGKYFPQIADVTMPCRLMLIFLPIGLLGLIDRRRWVLWLTLPLFIAIYALNPFFLEHYAILIIPAVLLTTLLGGQVLADAWPRWRREFYSAFAAVIFMACITSFWEVNRLVAVPGTEVSDETFSSEYLKNIHEYLPLLVEKPAVVLFTYHAGDNFFAEPVYNTDVAWPDDAEIIRAHDLGPIRNREIFAYYARTQPDRTFYIYDPSSKEAIKRLGTARQLVGAKREVK